MEVCRSQWPHGLRRRFAAVRLLGMRVEVCASGWSLVQRSPTDCGVSECDGETSIMRRPWPTGGAVVPQKMEVNRHDCF